MTNTAGTVLGVLVARLGSSALRIAASVSKLRTVLEEPWTYAVVAAIALACLGAWQPFDFRIDVSSVLFCGRLVLAAPFRLSPVLTDEAVVALRFAFVVLALATWQEKLGRSRATAVTAAAVAVTLGLSLELSQLFVASRLPSFQDALTILAGSGLGWALSCAIPRWPSRGLWASVLLSATLVVAAIQGLSPFRWRAHSSGLNWVPFLPHYEQTTFETLSSALEGALVFVPLGFLLPLVFPGRRQVAMLGMAFTLSLALLLELAQGFVETRFADVTDVIGAGLGFGLGLWASTRGWERWNLATQRVLARN
jgi:glycopeptide antibiotics resistance protein